MIDGLISVAYLLPTDPNIIEQKRRIPIMTSPLSVNLITRTKILDDNINLFKSIPADLFTEILRRIRIKEEFQENEYRHLEEQYGLEKNKISCVIETICYLHKQLSKVILNPTDIKKFLIEHLGIEENKSQLLVDTWTEDLRNNFDLESKRKVLNISWELNAQATSTFVKRESSLSATIEFKLADKRPADNLIMKLDEEEMLHLYNMLENIQTKLDSI